LIPNITGGIKQEELGETGGLCAGPWRGSGRPPPRRKTAASQCGEGIIEIIGAKAKWHQPRSRYDRAIADDDD
jgi:hypothetical protein